MKIKLAILEKDEVYLKRLESVFSVKYADKLEIFATTEPEIALEALRVKKIDVFLADEAFEIGAAQIPPSCGFAYLVDAADVEKIRDITAVCKFQKAEGLYRQILGLFSEKTAAVTGAHMTGEGSKVLAFVSAAGGTGSSAAAAACAMRFARKGKKALYLNLERFGSADVFFQGEGNTGLSDVIYAVKGRKGNLAMKLESMVRQDDSGVFFYAGAKLALNMAELSSGETREIVSVLRTSGGYDYIVLDLDFSIEQDMLKLWEECDSIVFVADGSAVSNAKLERAVASLDIMERDQKIDKQLLMRCAVLYNRFSSQTSRKAQVSDMKELGGIKRYEGFDTDRLLLQLREQAVFDTLE